MSNIKITENQLLFGGITGILTIVFIPAIAIQMSTGWFPETNLNQGSMVKWLENLTIDPSLSLLGVGIFTLAVLLFMPTALVLFRLNQQKDWLSMAALSVHIMGITLAFVAFLFGYGFTWAISDLQQAQVGETSDLVIASTLGMRAFLVSDDIGTALIGLGNGLLGLSFLKSGQFPKWLCWMGMVAGFLVSIVLLRSFIPAMTFATIGYPLVILWFVFSGIFMIRNRQRLLH